jgi:small subunit ribosomal protein S11
MIHHVHIQTTLNNTIITLTDTTGKTKVSASAGSLGFKNSRKSNGSILPIR